MYRVSLTFDEPLFYAAANAAAQPGSSSRGLFTWRLTGTIAGRFSGAKRSRTSTPVDRCGCLRRRSHRHSVMKCWRGVVRRRGQDGEGLDDIAPPAFGGRDAKHRTLGYTPAFP